MAHGNLCTHYQLIKWAHMGMDLELCQVYTLEELEKRAKERNILPKLHRMLQNHEVFRPAPLWKKDLAPRIILEAFLLSRGCKASVKECMEILRNCNVKDSQKLIVEHCSCRNGVARMATIASTSLSALGTRLRHHATANALDSIASVYDKRGTIGATDYGDAVFRHPFVKCLLKSARQQVAEALDRKSNQWMICVRTYGRTGNPRYGTWPKRNGKAAKGVLELTLAALERALGPSVHKKVFIFVSHEDQDFINGRLSAALYGTPWENRIVIGVKGADLQTRFIEEAFPKSTSVVIADDNIVDFIAEHSLKKVRKLDDGKELGKLITRATADMQKKGASIWGLNSSVNPSNYHSFGELVRRGSSEVAENVGLIYGAFFGILTQRDGTLYTRWGQVGDDVERSIRFWQRDGIMLRYKMYGVQKSHQPGVWSSSKRGISSASGSAKEHTEEKRSALKGVIEEFAEPCCRLPRPGESSNVGRCGVVWLKGGSSPAATKKRPSSASMPPHKRSRHEK